MKTEGTPGMRTLGRVALSLAAVVALSCAADEPSGAPLTASLAGPAQASSDGSSVWQQECGRHGVADPLVGPDGHEFRLAYVPGYGCKYVVGGRTEILVDAPNGYAFALTRSGWKILSASD